MRMDVVYCKQLWGITSGTHILASNDAVLSALKSAEKQITQGLSFYKPPNELSVEVVKGFVTKDQLDFVCRITKLLNVEANLVWDMLKNYFAYEFRGSEESLKEFTSYVLRTPFLVKDIYYFHMSECLFLLQTIKMIILYVEDRSHPHQAIFKQFLDGVDLNALKGSFIQQLRNITGDYIPSRKLNGEFFNDYMRKVWITFNLHEQLELSQILLFYFHQNEFTTKDFRTVFEIFRFSGFGLDQPYDRYTTDADREQMQKICYVQTVLVLYMMGFGSTKSEGIWTDEESYNAINESISKMPMAPGVASPFQLCWTLLNMHCKSEEELFAHRSLGETLLTTGHSLSYLSNMLQHSLFQEKWKLRDIAYETVSVVVNTLFTSFDPDSLIHIKDLWTLGQTLLKHPIVAREFWESGTNFGLRWFFQQAEANFPFRFQPFIGMCTSLAEAGSESNIKLLHEMSNQTVFAEKVTESLIRGGYFDALPGTGHSALQRKPLQYSPLTIPVGTPYRIPAGYMPLCTWDFKYDAWIVLSHEISLIVRQAEDGMHTLPPGKLTNLMDILQCLEAVVKHITENIPVDFPYVKSSYDQILSITERFSQVSHPHRKILSACMNILAALTPTYSPEEYFKVIRSGLIPCVQDTTLNYQAYHHRQSFSEGFVGEILHSEECIAGRYEILKSYLNFFVCALKHPNIDEKCLLGGTVFVMWEVFHKHSTWSYKNENDKLDITVFCLEIIHELLSFGMPDVKKLTTAQTICVDHLMNSTSAEVLLSIIGTGDHVLQAAMENESNWLTGRGRTYIAAVQLSLSIFNRLIILRHLLVDDLGPTLIEGRINQKSKTFDLNVVLIISHYIYHSFDPALPILAIKILKRLAVEYPMTLLSYLDVRKGIFTDLLLSKLDSDADDVNLKVAILEFITACIKSQPGLTEIFVNIKTAKKRLIFIEKEVKPETKEYGGCLNTVTCFLKDSVGLPHVVKDRMYAASVAVVETVWLGQRTTAMDYFKKWDTFWENLCYSLFIERQNLEVTAMVLNTIATELYLVNMHISESLSAVLSKFFNTPHEHLKRWSEIATGNSPKSENDSLNVSGLDTMENSFLICWKNFLTVILKHENFNKMLSECQFLSIHAFDTLVRELDVEKSTNMKIVVHVAELYLLLLSHWRDFCFHESYQAMADIMSEFIYKFEYKYSIMHHRAKEAILSIIIKIVDICAEHSPLTDTHTRTYFHCVQRMMKHELITTFEKAEPEDCNDYSRVNAPVLIVTLLTTVVEQHEETKHLVDMLYDSKAMDIIVSALRYALPRRICLGFIEKAMEALMFVGSTGFGKYLINIELMNEVWMPLIYIKDYADSTGSKYWQKVYVKGIEAFTWTFRSVGAIILYQASGFLELNRDHMIKSLWTIQHDPTPDTLNMARASASYIMEISTHKLVTNAKYEPVFRECLAVTRSALASCILLLLRPRYLKALLNKPTNDKTSTQLLEGNEDQFEVTPQLLEAQHKLLDIACLCVNTFRISNPNVTTLLTDTMEVNWDGQLELVFATPRILRENEPTQLTFGTLFAAANMATQALGKVNRTSSPSRFAMTQMPSPCTLLHPDKVNFLFETSLFVVYQQGLMLLLDSRTSETTKQYLCRELGAEITMVFENVRKAKAPELPMLNFATSAPLRPTSRTHFSLGAPATPPTQPAAARALFPHGTRTPPLPLAPSAFMPLAASTPPSQPVARTLFPPASSALSENKSSLALMDVSQTNGKSSVGSMDISQSSSSEESLYRRPQQPKARRCLFNPKGRSSRRGIHSQMSSDGDSSSETPVGSNESSTPSHPMRELECEFGNISNIRSYEDLQRKFLDLMWLIFRNVFERDNSL